MVHSQDHNHNSSRKAKKPRIPKRGPGVAELEKILREQDQQKANGHTHTHNHIDNKVSSSSSSFSFSSFLHGYNTNNIHVNANGVGVGGSSKGVYIGGSGVYLPEKTLLPISWNDHREPTSDFSFPVLASNGSDDHTKMMDFFQSSSTASRVYNHRDELPSCQRDYTSTLGHDQDKILMGSKRTRSNFPIENWRPVPPPPPPPRMSYQPIRPKVSRLDSSSSSTSNGFLNLGISRNPLDHGNPSGNTIRNLIIESPTTPLPSTDQNRQPDMTKFIRQFPYQENTEGSNLLQRSSSTEPAEVSVRNKSFISFLSQQEDQAQRGSSSAEATPCLKNEKCCSKKTGDFIDLDLKL